MYCFVDYIDQVRGGFEEHQEDRWIWTMTSPWTRPFSLSLSFAAVTFFEFSFYKTFLSVRIQPTGRRHPRQFHSARSPAQRCEIFQRKYFVIFDQIQVPSRGDVLHDNRRPTYFPILDSSAQRPAGYLELSTQLKCT
jgi:hypothetical protein